MTENPSPPIEGIEEWLELVDQALQGLHHRLDGCIASISAQLEDSPADQTGLSNLATELVRLEDCNRMVCLLPHDAVAGEETLILDDVLNDVLAIHRYLHDARELEMTIAPSSFVEPVRVERWAFEFSHSCLPTQNDWRRKPRRPFARPPKPTTRASASSFRSVSHP